MKKILLPILILALSVHYHTVEAQTVQLEVEPNHSTVGFSISIAGFTRVTGKFNNFKIDVDYVDGDLSKSIIRAEIDASSIDTGIDARDDHLRTADFFDVEKYPTINFTSSKIFPYEDHYLAIGEFSMHGVSNEIVLPFKIMKQDGNTVGFSCRTSLNRIDYGVGKEFKHTSMPEFLSDTIAVEIDFWTRKNKEPKE